MEIGVRELKARLSEYLERVREGEVLTVTSRGRAIAQLVPMPGRGSIEQGLRDGWLSHLEEASLEAITAWKPAAGRPTAAEALEEDRRA